ncbi:unnamed protein product, partial [Oncorhynchus mykiss]
MCYVYDFSLNDLLAPKVKRTVTILSGIMNYLHFRKQRLDMTMGHQERFVNTLSPTAQLPLGHIIPYCSVTTETHYPL